MNGLSLHRAFAPHSGDDDQGQGIDAADADRADGGRLEFQSLGVKAG